MTLLGTIGGRNADPKKATQLRDTSTVGDIGSLLIQRWQQTRAENQVDSWSLLLRRDGKAWKRYECNTKPGPGFVETVLHCCGERWDTAEVVFSVETLAASKRAPSWLPANQDRGILGLRLVLCGQSSDWPPTRMLAENVDFKSAFDRALAELGVPPLLFKRMGGQAELYRAICFIALKNEKTVDRLERGIPVADNRHTRTDHLYDFGARLCDWLGAHVDRSGQMTYMYEPGMDRAADRNNTIRQFMATVGLGRASRRFNRRELGILAKRNLRFNLDKFHRVIGGHAVISYGGSAKLGASALAALAILDQQGDSGDDRETLAGLVAGIEHLWQEDGMFHTFFFPEGRNDNQNFYPGEALYFLAQYAAVKRDEALRSRVEHGIWAYRRFHLEQRNPAFVPWHTQACRILFDHNRNIQLARWIFEMNDWLLDLQDLSSSYPDFVGRFHDPSRPEFGPPHASSTAVYLEGLADAAHVAGQVGDSVRVERYEIAAASGFANLYRLQYRDRRDSFFAPKLDKTLGGMRTNPYDSMIRVDNVQHSLAAVIKWLEVNPLLSCAM